MPYKDAATRREHRRQLYARKKNNADRGISTPPGGALDDNRGTSTPPGGALDDDRGTSTPPGGALDDDRGISTPLQWYEDELAPLMRKRWREQFNATMETTSMCLTPPAEEIQSKDPLRYVDLVCP